GREKFRPRGWEDVLARALRHDSPWVREVALESLPVPAPQATRALLPALVEDANLDVQKVACKYAERTRDRELVRPVLAVLKTTRRLRAARGPRNTPSTGPGRREDPENGRASVRAPDMLQPRRAHAPTLARLTHRRSPPALAT